MRTLLKEACSPAWKLVSIASQRGVLCLCGVNKGQAGFGSSMYSSVVRSLVLIIFGNWLVDLQQKACQIFYDVFNFLWIFWGLFVCLFLFCFGFFWYVV